MTKWRQKTCDQISRRQMIKSRLRTDDEIKTEDKWSNQDRGQTIKSRQRTDDQINTEEVWSNQVSGTMIISRENTDDQTKTEDRWSTRTRSWETCSRKLEKQEHEELHELRSLSEVTIKCTYIIFRSCYILLLFLFYFSDRMLNLCNWSGLQTSTTIYNNNNNNNNFF